MTQLTVRGFDKELERRLREVARRDGVSLNRAALHLLRRGAGLGDAPARTNQVGNALDHLAGAWSATEADEVRAATRVFERVDPELWS